MTVVLEARALTYAIRGKRLVDDVSLALPSGRLTVVVGPNGAGKSTLLKLLSGELRPQSGRVCYDGVPAQQLRPERLACMRAVMTQHCRLSAAFSVREVARVSIEFIGSGLAGDRGEALIEACLNEAGVLHLAERDYTTLSGGEQQRARFAACLSQIHAGRTVAPKQAFLLDEPIASLDLDRQLALMDAARLLSRRDGVAVLVVLHDLNMAIAYADELVVMRNGQIVAQGRPRDALSNAVLSDVFNVDLKLDAALPADMPFILPQHHAARGQSHGLDAI